MLISGHTNPNGLPSLIVSHWPRSCWVWACQVFTGPQFPHGGSIKQVNNSTHLSVSVYRILRCHPTHPWAMSGRGLRCTPIYHSSRRWCFNSFLWPWSHLASVPIRYPAVIFVLFLSPYNERLWTSTGYVFLQVLCWKGGGWLEGDPWLLPTRSFVSSRGWEGFSGDA